jgi:hypothetical protein
VTEHSAQAVSKHFFGDITNTDLLFQAAITFQNLEANPFSALTGQLIFGR